MFISSVSAMQSRHSKPTGWVKLLKVQVDVPKITQPCPLQVPKEKGALTNLTLQPALERKFSDTEKHI